MSASGNLSIESINIQDVNADVIINSIGVGEGIKKYGAVCTSIVNKVNSSQYEKIINNAKQVYVLGEFFTYAVDNNDLPFKYIINLITPYYEEDHNLHIYKDCIRRIFGHCLKLKGIKTIAIPVLGVGANGYPYKEAQDAITEIAEGFINTFPNYKVVIALGTTEANEKNKQRLAREMPTNRRREEIEKDVSKGSASYVKAHKILSSTNYDYKFFKRETIFTKSDDVVFKEGIKSVKEYSDRFVEEKYDYEVQKMANERVRAFLGYGKNNPKDAGSKTLSDLTSDSNIYRFMAIAFALRMNLAETEGFLNYFGKTFPAKEINPNVATIKELLKNQTYDLYDILKKVDIFKLMNK